jgi:hypothetical protein
VKQASLGESHEVQAELERSREYRLGAGLYWDVFSAVSLTAEVVDGLIREGSIFHTGGGIAIAKIGGEGGEVWRQICFVSGTPDAAEMLVRHVFGMHGQARINRKLAYMPQGSSLISVMREIGLKRTWPLVLFEKRTSGS